MLNPTTIELSSKDRKRKICLPFNLTEELAETVGAYLGDGCLNIYKWSRRTETYMSYRGHPLEDKLWYDEWLIPTMHALFGITLKGNYNSDGTYGIKFGSKAIVSFYHECIGLGFGKKTNATIPAIISEGPTRIKLSCIRGLFDTDGSLSFKKKHSDLHYYPVISLSNISKPLIEDTAKILLELGLNLARSDYLPHDSHCRTHSRIYKIDLNGKENLKKWMQLIGFHNFKHKSKYDVWKKYGHCEPTLSSEERRKLTENGPEGI